MPEMIHYTVTQTRDVQVWANNSVDAVEIAQIAFEKGTDSNGSLRFIDKPMRIEGNVTRRIIEQCVEVKRL